MVETVRRYSKQPHLWRTSKRLAKLMASPAAHTEPTLAPTYVHKLRQRLSDETVAALLGDYRSGASLKDLQRTYSLGRSSVQQLLRDEGVRRRRKTLTEGEMAMLAERYKQGMTIREIAAEQGLAKTTVQDALTRGGVEMRSAARRVQRHSN
jgi:uncharacterized protein (DUF433 family)